MFHRVICDIFEFKVEKCEPRDRKLFSRIARNDGYWLMNSCQAGFLEAALKFFS